MIDVAQTTLAAIDRVGSDLELVFPRQLCFSDAQGENPMRVPYFECRLRVLNGAIGECGVELPFEPDYWHITLGNGDLLAEMLPARFEANGPVELSFFLKDSSIALSISGSGATLIVGSQIGVAEFWPQPNKSLEPSRDA